jgi:VanZ family protein
MVDAGGAMLDWPDRTGADRGREDRPLPDRTEGLERTLLTWLPPSLWALVIFLASELPGSAVPGRFSSLAHIVEYAIFGVLLFLAMRRSSALQRAMWTAFLIASAYGVTDELHQAFTPGRTPDPVDWSLDTIGAALGIVLVALLKERLAARRQ